MKKMSSLWLPALLALIALTLCVPSVHADAVGGPYTAAYWLAPGSTHQFTFTFYGGEWAHVEATGTADIDLKVRDIWGRLVESDTDSDRFPMCGWLPPYTRVYTVEVINAERFSVFYTLDVN